MEISIETRQANMATLLNAINQAGTVANLLKSEGYKTLKKSGHIVDTDVPEFLQSAFRSGYLSMTGCEVQCNGVYCRPVCTWVLTDKGTEFVLANT